MKLNTQLNKKWASDDMGMKGDKIWRWGCVITSLANMYQDYIGKSFTPKQMNSKLKKNKGYRGKPESKASFIQWHIFCTLFNAKIARRCKPLEYESNNRFYWIACIKHKQGGYHYINVLNKTNNYFICFDVEYGDVVNLKEKKIVYLHRIEFIGGVR